MFDRIRPLLKSYGLPSSDDFARTPSTQTFEDGTHFAIEISSVNNLHILNRIIELADNLDVRLNRVDECRGIFRLPKAEIKEMVRVCKDRNIGLFMSVGPRAIYDIGGFTKTNNGARVGYRLRGMDNLIRGIEDVLFAADLGVRGFLIYDEGHLKVLSQMKANGQLPADCAFKLSVHTGCSNPASGLIYQELGATSLNVVPDLDLPMLAAFRQTIKIPLDVFSDTASDAGGFIRTYEVPDMIRVGAPVYLKCGPVSQKHQNHLPTDSELEERMKQTRCVVEMIDRASEGFRQVVSDASSYGLPRP